MAVPKLQAPCLRWGTTLALLALLLWDEARDVF